MCRLNFAPIQSDPRIIFLETGLNSVNIISVTENPIFSFAFGYTVPSLVMLVLGIAPSVTYSGPSNKHLCLRSFSSKSQEDLLSIDFSQPTLSSTSEITTSSTTATTTSNSQPNQLTNFPALSPPATNSGQGKYFRQNVICVLTVVYAQKSISSYICTVLTCFKYVWIFTGVFD